MVLDAAANPAYFVAIILSPDIFTQAIAMLFYAALATICAPILFVIGRIFSGQWERVELAIVGILIAVISIEILGALAGSRILEFLSITS